MRNNSIVDKIQFVDKNYTSITCNLVLMQINFIDLDISC